jgi:methionyl-tRNA formyltransferase
VICLTQNYLIVSEKIWNAEMHLALNKLGIGVFSNISAKQNLNVDYLRIIKPRYIFFPHWSHIIPESIFNEFECVVFHMTDLPYGRGGSPLQNLILEGVEDTKISAIKVVEGLDAGPVFMKRDLSLSGSASQIFERASSIIECMIEEMVLNPLQPTPQVGHPTVFKRRIPQQSNIKAVDSGEKVFDMIRMLDADGYPHAYIEIDNFRVEFTKVAKSNGKISAKASFIKLKKEV